MNRNQELLYYRTYLEAWNWEANWDHRLDRFVHPFSLGVKTKDVFTSTFCTTKTING